jgi:hypothetical protein
VTMNARKMAEREYLDSFRHFCKDFPEGEIIAGEAPDFIVTASGYRIGIEITKIFTHGGGSRTALQSIEAARDRITALAKTYARNIGVPPRAITLFFNWTLPLYRNQEAAIAQAVAQTVFDRLPPPDQSADLECRYGSIQPREVDQILVHRVNRIEGFEWNWVEASRRVEDAIPYIADAIKRKEKTINACLSECDECWRLIVAGEPTLRASGNIRPNKNSLDYKYFSPFKRTYFLDNARQHRQA